MGILNSAKAEPTDPVRGLLNDVFDVVGFPRPEEALGTPADIMHQAGLPTVKEAFPMPADVGARVLKPLRGGRLPGLPDMSRFAPDRLFPFPGEASRDADEGASENATPDEQSAAYRQRYYQKPPFP